GGGQWRRYSRTTVVEYSAPTGPGGSLIYGPSATVTITVTVTVERQTWDGVPGHQWQTDQSYPELTCTHSRTKTADINSQTGVLTIRQDPNEDPDGQQNGISVTIDQGNEP